MVNAVQDSTNRRKQIVEASNFLSIDLIDQHMLQPIKLHTMVQDFMTKLEKDMSILDDNISLNNATLEQMTYMRIKSLYDQLEA
jgi:HD superfamily phosphohydrolase YqeK